MLKYLLIGLVLVQATLQVEFATQSSDVHYGHDDSKRYKKEYYKKENKHKKHMDEDDYKYSRDSHYRDDYNKEKYYDKYDGPEYKKHKHGDERKKRHDERNSYVSVPEMERPMSLARDMEVNSQNVNRHMEPQSEYIQHQKRAFYLNMKKLDLSTPPDPNNTALMARYIVHNVDWAAMATLTTRLGGKNSPFANIFSMSDGPVDQGSGVPFFYLTPMDLSTQDLIRENRASVTATLAQTSYCKTSKLDPEDPRCAKIILSGKVKRIKPDTVEEEFARKALFTRHPVMESWPKDHDFYFAKLKIGQIILLDQFGGPKNIDIEEYLNVD